MKRYRIHARLESPLVVRRERQSQRSEGAQCLAGTLFRGALAQLYLQRFGRADSAFHRMFLDEEACRFGPLDPSDRIFPLTANSCKRQPGFVEDSKHGVLDLLAALVRPRLSSQDWPHQRCPACGQELKPHTGFWRLKADGSPTDPKRLWRRVSTAHVGIDRYTHTAEESVLFTLPALEPEPAEDGEEFPAVLHGWLEAEDDVLASLQDLLRDEDGSIRVGHARTRGYGRLRVTIMEEMSAAVSDREAWSRTMLSQAAAGALDPARHFLFSLSLPAGAVLVDQLLRYTLDPAGMVPWLPPLPAPNPADRVLARPGKAFAGGRLWCVTAVARHERLRGWNAAHGLPRQDEWAVSRGAVYVYLYEGDADGRDELLGKLSDMERESIGARRNEGFGRVLICDDFHTRFIAKEAT